MKHKEGISQIFVVKDKWQQLCVVESHVNPAAGSYENLMKVMTKQERPLGQRKTPLPTNCLL